VQAAVGSHCLDCAKAARPDVATRAKYWNARQHTLVTYVLMAINIAVFLYVTISDPGSLGGRSGVSKAQFDLGLNEYFLIGGRHEWYRLITSGFLHFGVIHIAFNMLLLYQLGQLLERPLGRAKFGLLYAAALLGGSFGVLIIGGQGITGGASGAVFGLMGATAAILYARGINPFQTSIGTLIIFNLLFSLAGSNISLGGHLGGLIGGGLAGLAFAWAERHRRPDLIGWAACVVVAVVSVAASLAVV